MAAPTYLGEVSRNGFGAGSIDLTPLGLQADDIVLVLDSCASNANSRNVGASTSGYANVAAKISANDTYDCNSIISWKRMGGTPDTSVSVVSTGNSQDARRTVVRAYRGVDATTMLDVAEVTATGTNGLLFDASAITPATADALIVVFGMGATVKGSTTAFSAPSDLVDWASDYTNSAAYHCVVGVGHKVWASGAFNPDAWTGPTSNTTDSRAGWTIALRPAVAAMSGDASGSFDVTGAAQATNSVAGQTSGALGLDGSATGTVSSAGITGAASGDFAVTGQSSGAVAVVGAAAGQLGLMGTAEGLVASGIDGSASGTFDITVSAVAAVPVVRLYRGDDAPDWRRRFYDRQIKEFEEALEAIPKAEEPQDAAQEAVEAFTPLAQSGGEAKVAVQAITEALRGLTMQAMKRKEMQHEIADIRAELARIEAYRRKKRNNEAAILLLAG